MRFSGEHLSGCVEIGVKALCDSKNDIGYNKNKLIHSYKKIYFFLSFLLL